MDSSVTKIDDEEPFFHVPSASANPRSSSKSIDFLTDDVLPDCDFSQQQRRPSSSDQGSNNPRRHLSAGSPVYLTGELYPARKERDVDSNEHLIVSAVEQTIKKYADNILKYLDGMSGRLSQLESVTHVLEHSIASLKASVDEYHAEADVKTRLLNENIREMHRGVQILRDRQDIIETQAELAKLQASKADALIEKKKIAASATIDSPISSQSVFEEKQSSALISRNMLVPNQSQVPSLQPSDAAGQLQNLSSSSDSNTLPQQQYLSSQPQIQHNQQPHGQLQLVPAQSQQSHVLQAVPVLGTGQQPQTMNQTSMMHQQPEPVQPQGIPQHLQVQPTAGGMPQVITQPSSQGTNPQYMSTSTTSPAQTTFQTQQPHQGSSAALQHVPTQIMSQPQQPHQGSSAGLQHMPAQIISQPQQVHVPVTPQLQAQNLPQNTPIANQMFLPAQHNSTVQSQGNPVHDAYRFTGENKNQTYSPSLSGIPASSMPGGYGVRAYGSANTLSFQQQRSMAHLPQSPQPNSTPYQRNPLGPQPSFTAQPQPTGSNAHSLPMAQIVHGEAASAGRSNTLSQDGIVEKLAAMGYPREQVRSVIRGLIDRGQFVDVNVVLDILMNGERQPRRAWPR